MIDRYRDIVSDWERFRSSSYRPEPVTLRVRTRLIEPDELRSRLATAGFVLEPVDGLDGYFRVVEGPGSVAQTVEHWLGLFHVQQAVMALPVLALDPRSGDRVLDLCAAPGGKTAHLSELMGGEGPLVAVDPKEKRIRGLLANIYRLGCTNVIVVAADGRELPVPSLFDRVLVDAPCSGEGNFRRQRGKHSPRGSGFATYVARLQESLLRRAVELTRPGGTIVYSTCTYAPEENETIVDRVLADCPVSLEPISIGIPHDHGLEVWEGRSYSSQLARAWRVYPHHLDSGGLFMARLRRDSGPAAPDSPVRDQDTSGSAGWSAIPGAFTGEDEDVARARLESAAEASRLWFDLSGLRRKGLEWMVRGKHIWTHTARRWPMDSWAQSGHTNWRVVSVGLRGFRSGPQGSEIPTSQLLTQLAAEVSPERAVHVTTAQLRHLLDDEHLPIATDQLGPVALVWEGIVLGRGLARKDGLTHEIRRAQARRLLTLLRLLDPADTHTRAERGGSSRSPI